jgi:hypothetical protein
MSPRGTQARSVDGPPQMGGFAGVAVVEPDDLKAPIDQRGTEVVVQYNMSAPMPMINSSGSPVDPNR